MEGSPRLVSRRWILRGAVAAVTIAACGDVPGIEVGREPVDIIEKTETFGKTQLFLPKGDRSGDQGVYLSTLKEDALNAEFDYVEKLSSPTKPPFSLKVSFFKSPKIQGETVIVAGIINNQSGEIVRGWTAQFVTEIEKVHKLKVAWRNWKFNEILWDDKPLKKQDAPGK